MPSQESPLHANEAVVLDLRPHWWFFWRHTLALVVIVAFGITLLVFDLPDEVGYVAAVLIVAAVIWFGLRYIAWTTTHFVVTTDRLISRNGILTRSGVEIPLERINTVFFSQSLFERILGSGDLRIESAGEQGTSHFTDIRKPLDVQNEIYRQMEDNENRKYDRMAQGLVSNQSPAAAVSITDQIDQLDQLRSRGLLTDAEFDQKKTELLRRM